MTMAGTGQLLRMAVRRDRILLPAWVLVFVVVAASSAAAVEGLYPSVQDRVSAAEAVNGTPALVAIYGPVYDVRSLGALAFFKLIVFGAALVGLLCALLVIRHTRADEELGRTELVASGAVGRHAPLVAAVLVGAIAAFSIGVLTAAICAAAGLETSGCVAVGVVWAGSGLAFTGVGAVAAQLTASARAARGIAVTVLLTAYVLRAVADVSDAGWLTWLSPLGWAQQVRPFAGDRFLLLVPLVVFAVGAVGVAMVLQERRDLGSGLVAARPGPAEGSVGTAIGLAVRLHRATLAGWTVGVFLLGLLVGSLVTHLGGFFDSPQVREFIESMGGKGAVADAFVSTELGFAALAIGGYALSALSRMRAEESTGHIENVLATGTGRVAWMAGHVVLTLVAAGWLTLVTGIGIGVAHAAQTGNGPDLATDVTAALVRVPAIWVIAGVGALLFGLAGRLTAYSWAILVACVVVGEFGKVMGLPGWTDDLSPYSHVPALPAVEFEAAPLVWLLVVAAALTAAGLFAFRRRDVAAG
jgi:ABC-2 type transport system permease protein